MDSTIQILSGMLGSADDEVSMVNGLDSTISYRADPGVGGGLDTLMANKWKILGGLAAAGVLYFGFRWWRARRLASSAPAMAGLAGRRSRRRHAKARRNRRRAA